MKKLEIELFRYENFVFGRVLYQDESLRKQGTKIEKKDLKFHLCQARI